MLACPLRLIPLLGAVALGGAVAAGHGDHRKPAPAGARLNAAYRVRLTSEWPVLAGESARCNNGGHEVLSGTLTRLNDTLYAGQFNRSTRLGFCGAHGAAQVQACSLTLTGDGVVDVRAFAVAEGGDTKMYMVWAPDAPATRVNVAGTCSNRFRHALRTMYLSVARQVDFPVVIGAAGKQSLSLDDYGWVLELE